MVGQSPCHMEKVGLGLETIATMLTRRQPFVPLAPTGKKRTQRLPEAKNEEQKLILKGYGYYANEELVPATGDIFPSIFNQPKLSLFSEMEMGKTGSGNFNVRRVLVWLGTYQIDIDAKEELRFESVVEFLRDEDKETFKRASKFGEGVLDGAFYGAALSVGWSRGDDQDHECNLGQSVGKGEVRRYPEGVSVSAKLLLDGGYSSRRSDWNAWVSSILPPTNQEWSGDSPGRQRRFSLEKSRPTRLPSGEQMGFQGRPKNPGSLWFRWARSSRKRRKRESSANREP